MKTFTVKEYADHAGISTTTVYRMRSTVLKDFHKVLNGKQVLEFPDDIDPFSFVSSGSVFNTRSTDVQQVSTHVQQRSTGVQRAEAASDPAELVELRAKVEVLSADKRELQAQLDGLKGILAGKDETIATQQQRIDALERDKVYLQGQYQQQAELLNRFTLPAPKKTLGERVKAALGIRPKEQ